MLKVLREIKISVLGGIFR